MQICTAWKGVGHDNQVGNYFLGKEVYFASSVVANTGHAWSEANIVLAIVQRRKSICKMFTNETKWTVCDGNH